jgi:hypothetical protein
MMTRERYAQWMAVWRWFQLQPQAHEHLYGLLNEMWQQDRQSCTPEQLADYSQPIGIENDPKFREFLRKLDQSFFKDPPTELS